MRPFLLIVSAGILVALIAIGTTMARSTRAYAHATEITLQR